MERSSPHGASSLIKLKKHHLRRLGNGPSFLFGRYKMIKNASF
jgi:hypothetical protein